MYTNAVFKRETEKSMGTSRSFLVPLHGYAHMFVVPFSYWNSLFHRFSFVVQWVHSSCECESILYFCWICMCNVSREKLQIWSRAVHMTIEFYWQSFFSTRKNHAFEIPFLIFLPQLSQIILRKCFIVFKKTILFMTMQHSYSTQTSKLVTRIISHKRAPIKT